MVTLMKEFGEFLVENWQPLVAGLLAVISFICALVRKKPSAWSLSDYVRLIEAQFLPTYIIDAEQSGFSGNRKKEIVLSKCMKALKGFIRCDDKQLDSAYVQFADALEVILSTPRKKD